MSETEKRLEELREACVSYPTSAVLAKSELERRLYELKEECLEQSLRSLTGDSWPKHMETINATLLVLDMLNEHLPLMKKKINEVSKNE